jgi:hypothetical protein
MGPRDRDVYVVLVLSLKLLVGDLPPVLIETRRAIVLMSHARNLTIRSVLYRPHVRGNCRVCRRHL